MDTRFGPGGAAICGGRAHATIAALALLAAAPAPLPAQPIQEQAAMGPDFSHVTSIAAARKLVRSHDLVAIHLFPRALGGPDAPENIGYVTPEAAAWHGRTAGTIARLRAEGSVEQMEVLPDYQGASVVPTRIQMRAWHRTKPGSFEVVIQVW